MENRQDSIHSKGFNMGHAQFNLMKTGKGVLQDAVLDLGTLKAINRNYANKSLVLKALADRDLTTLREISKYFYRTSGIYYRACNYLAQMYRYDWYIVPEIYQGQEADTDKIIKDFYKSDLKTKSAQLKELLGHTPYEVIIGALLGSCIAVSFHYLLS